VDDTALQHAMDAGLRVACVVSQVDHSLLIPSGDPGGGEGKVAWMIEMHTVLPLLVVWSASGLELASRMHSPSHLGTPAAGHELTQAVVQCVPHTPNDQAWQGRTPGLDHLPAEPRLLTRHVR